MISVENVTNNSTPLVQPRKHRNRAAIIGSSIILVGALAGAGWYGYSRYDRQQIVSKIPASVREQISYPIYAPTDETIELKTESIVYSNNILQYSVVVSGTTLLVTQQIKSGDFELAKFATSDALKSTEQDKLAIGSQLKGSLRDKYISIIDTGPTIITTTGSATDTNTKSAIDALTRSLRKL